MTDRTVGIDGFSAAIEDIASALGAGSRKAIDRAVEDGARLARRKWRSNARGTFGGSGRYARSIQCKVRRGAAGDTTAEVGSRSLPGLPHLLEKGHATVGGNPVQGREHIANAADEAFEEAFGDFLDAMEEVLSQ